VALAVMGAIAFLPGLDRRPIVTSHEARIAQTARQMAVCGWPWRATPVRVAPVQLVKTSDSITRLQPRWGQTPIAVNPWLVPVLNGEIRLQKPPLPYWCAAILFRLRGVEWNEGLSRLTPALLGALGTFLVYGLARRLLGRIAGWCASIVWVSTYFIAEQYRLAMADPYLAFFTLLCVYAWVRSTPDGEPYDEPSGVSPSVGDGAGWLVILFYVSLALGLLAKGPPMLPHVAIPILAFHATHRRCPPMRLLTHLLGLAIVALLVAPWIAYVFGHVPRVVEMWRYESIGELPGADNVEKARRFWYYVPNLLVMTAPWTPLWIAGILQPFVRRRRRQIEAAACADAIPPQSALSYAPRSPARRRRWGQWFGLAWYFAIIVFFSLLPVKKDTYLLPGVPAQTLIIASALAALLAGLRRGFDPSALLAWVQTGIGIAAGITMIVLVIWRVHSDRGVALLVAVLALAASTGALAELRGRRGSLWLWRQAIAYVLLIATVLAFYRVDDDAQRSAKPVCDELLPILRQTGDSLALTKLPEEVSLYLPLDLAQPRPAGRVVVIVDDPRRQIRHPPHLRDRVPGREIVSIERVSLRSTPDEGRWKVFRLTVE
jgi:4-amino-4-deoxy-L-arabinose transferase-like glycosyltransferase